MKPHQLRLEQCEAAREIAAEFGVFRAIAYLVAERAREWLLHD